MIEDTVSISDKKKWQKPVVIKISKKELMEHIKVAARSGSIFCRGRGR